MWARPIHEMVLEDMREAARLKGAKTQDEVVVLLAPRDENAPRRRRIVAPRAGQ